MAEVVFRPVEDGQSGLVKSDIDYFTARNATDAASDEGTAKIGQRYLSPDYYLWRGGFCFDTSGLDDNCLIQSATLWLRIVSSNNGLGTVMVKSGMPTYPHIPAVVGDYNRTLYSGNGGTATADYPSFTITLNDTGRSWIDKTGNTKFMVMSQNDIDGSAPTSNEWAQITPGGDNRPKLTVEYYIPTGPPAVTSEGPCVDKQSTTMTAVGNVTDDGGGYEARGFEYYEDSSEYDSEMYAVRELGVFTGTGNYEMTINGLKPETTYQIRAWVKNVYGLVYGDWYTCTTIAVLAPSYGVHEEDNTATICFYISEDDGKTWGQKHGPYTEGQSDIEITKLLVRGSGKKKIKFESDVLTGISASVLVKLDCKAR